MSNGVPAGWEIKALGDIGSVVTGSTPSTQEAKYWGGNIPFISPADFEGRVYERIGLKRYFGDNFFGAITLKAHGAKAEAVEFGVGVRL